LNVSREYISNQTGEPALPQVLFSDIWKPDYDAANVTLIDVMADLNLTNATLVSDFKNWYLFFFSPTGVITTNTPVPIQPVTPLPPSGGITNPVPPGLEVLRAWII